MFDDDRDDPTPGPDLLDPVLREHCEAAMDRFRSNMDLLRAASVDVQPFDEDRLP